MLTRWKILVLLCGGFVTGTEAAGTKTVQLELHLVVTQPPPCTVGGASVEFGDVLTTKVGDVSQTKPVGYSLNCDGRASDYLKLQIQGPPPPSRGAGSANFGAGVRHPYSAGGQ